MLENHRLFSVFSLVSIHTIHVLLFVFNWFLIISVSAEFPFCLYDFCLCIDISFQFLTLQMPPFAPPTLKEIIYNSQRHSPTYLIVNRIYPSFGVTVYLCGKDLRKEAF